VEDLLGSQTGLGFLMEALARTNRISQLLEEHRRRREGRQSGVAHVLRTATERAERAAEMTATEAAFRRSTNRVSTALLR